MKIFRGSILLISILIGLVVHLHPLFAQPDPPPGGPGGGDPPVGGSPLGGGIWFMLIFSAIYASILIYRKYRKNGSHLDETT